MSIEEQEAVYEAEKVAEVERDRENPRDLDPSDLSNLAQSDSLRLYLREIARIPLLSASREVMLAERAENGDREARNQLI